MAKQEGCNVDFKQGWWETYYAGYTGTAQHGTAWHGTVVPVQALPQPEDVLLVLSFEHLLGMQSLVQSCRQQQQSRCRVYRFGHHAPQGFTHVRHQYKITCRQPM